VGQFNEKVLGVLHPGAMGISVASALIDVGHRVCWASENRSAASLKRAAICPPFATNVTLSFPSVHPRRH